MSPGRLPTKVEGRAAPPGGPAAADPVDADATATAPLSGREAVYGEWEVTETAGSDVDVLAEGSFGGAFDVVDGGRVRVADGADLLARGDSTRQFTVAAGDDPPGRVVSLLEDNGVALPDAGAGPVTLDDPTLYVEERRVAPGERVVVTGRPTERTGTRGPTVALSPSRPYGGHRVVVGEPDPGAGGDGPFALGAGFGKQFGSLLAATVAGVFTLLTLGAGLAGIGLPLSVAAGHGTAAAIRVVGVVLFAALALLFCTGGVFSLATAAQIARWWRATRDERSSPAVLRLLQGGGSVLSALVFFGIALGVAAGPLCAVLGLPYCLSPP